MANEHVENLTKARALLVDHRRFLAAQMASGAPAHAANLAAGLRDLQDSIENIDRALKDEAELPRSIGERGGFDGD
jgi:hypothetical protein